MALKPLGQIESPAAIVSRVLASELGGLDKIGDQGYVFVDYCAGGGGPTPYIEGYINQSQTQQSQNSGGLGSTGMKNGNANGEAKGGDGVRTRSQSKQNGIPSGKKQGDQLQPVHFVLTDLHPHIPNWALASSASPQIHYAPQPVDASSSPPDLLSSISPPLPSSSPSTQSPRVFRTFNLAFHHFPDSLASAILRDTLRTSHGLAIFELQDRSLRSFLAVTLLGLGVLAFAPYYAVRWRSPATLFWCWVLPVLPFVLVWDGWMSALRTRTIEEVEALMRGCGVGEAEVARWEVRSGVVTHLQPFADVNWIIATKREH